MSLPELDVVYSVTDHWDRPRVGFAGFHGDPHYFECHFDDANDEWSDSYRLVPIDRETFTLAMEAWEIWARWQSAFQEGLASMDTHPALPEDALRGKQLKAILAERLSATSARPKFALAEWVPASETYQPGLLLPFPRVRWVEKV